MAADDFLGLTNRVLNAVNEVELTSSTFASASGFYAEAKNAVNQGLFDLYAHEGVEWPFLFNTLTFSTTRGIINYTKASTVIQGSVDWESFRIQRANPTVSSITQTSGTATVTTSGAHNFATGDYVMVDGADQDGYNTDNAAITVTGSTTFTYSVDSSTVSPATGTITLKSNTVTYSTLNTIDIHEYRKSYALTAENYTPDSYARPTTVAPTKAENFILLPASDRVYTIAYDAFSMPSRLVAHDDTHLVPEQWEQAIIDLALYRVYMFRDNMELAGIAADKAKDLIRQMRKALMPIQNNVNFG